MLTSWLRTSAACFLLCFAVLTGNGCAGAGAGQNPPASSPLSLVSVSPNTVQAGTGDAVLTIIGADFTSTSVAQAGGSALPTSEVSASKLLVVVPAAQVATAGVLSITVSDRGVTSGAASVSVNNPTPVITAVTPTSIPLGLSSVVVTVQGTGFVAGSFVQVNGMSRMPIVNSATQLTLTLGAADLTSAGNLQVSVVNTAPGGGSSSPTTLNVDPTSTTPEPTLTGSYPETLETAAPATTLYATGANYTPDCKVLWDGQPLTTVLTQTSKSLPPQLVAQLPPAAIPAAGTYTVNVACLQATTAPLTIAVVDPPAPQIITYPSPAIPVRTDTTFTITGSDFTTRSVGHWNGAALATTVIDNQHLSVTVPAAQIQTPANYALQVITAGPGGGRSKTFSVTGYIAVPNNDIAYNPANGLVYVSTTGVAPGPFLPTVATVNPATGEVLNPFGSLPLPTKIALSSDNKCLWVAETDSFQIAEFDLATKQMVYTNDYATYAGPTVTALAAIPGNDGAVALATYSPDYGATLQIGGADYTLGSTITPPRAIDALVVNGATNEIYAFAGDTYLVYTYGVNGLALKFSTQMTEGFKYSSLEAPTDVQFASGLLYTGAAQVYNPENGQAVGPIFLGPGLSDGGLGTPGGAMYVDVALGEIYFVPGLGYGAGVVYVFNLSDGGFITRDIEVSIADQPVPAPFDAYPSKLTRWTADGLLFHNATGVYVVQSPLLGPS